MVKFVHHAELISFSKAVGKRSLMLFALVALFIAAKEKTRPDAYSALDESVDLQCIVNKREAKMIVERVEKSMKAYGAFTGKRTIPEFNCRNFKYCPSDRRQEARKDILHVNIYSDVTGKRLFELIPDNCQSSKIADKDRYLACKRESEMKCRGEK